MIKNATLYRIAAGWMPSLEDMETALEAGLFAACAPTQEKATGWVPPRGEEHEALVESINGWRVLRFAIETKSVPGATVREAAQAKADEIEANTGRKPGKKETKALREDALLELLPHAFPHRASVWVLLNLERGWLITDASTQGKIDEVITALVRVFDGLALSLLQTKVSPQTAMTQWLLMEEPEDWPEGISVERECELRSTDEEKAVVRFQRHYLVNGDVRKHVTEGKLPTRLALSWEGRVGFVLDAAMRLRKIHFLEGVFDGQADKDDSSGFDADVALTTGELCQLIPALANALGGEQTSSQQTEVQP